MIDIFLSNQRYLILDGLSRQDGYSLNTRMLQELLIQFGHSVSLAAVNGLAAWLESVGLVKMEAIGESLSIVKLTDFGLDVARGNARVAGVDRPLPG